MLTLTKPITLADYFEQEEKSEEKHEYINGEIIQTAGGTPRHNTLIVNFLLHLCTKLNQDVYRVFVTDQRVWLPLLNIATYPDVMVTAEPLTYQEGRNDTLTNPIFIAEVLSPSTANYDRTDKFAYYRTIETFQEYLLISQDRLYIEHFYKEGDRWIFNAYAEETSIQLKSLEIAIATTDIYQRINFSE